MKYIIVFVSLLVLSWIMSIGGLYLAIKAIRKGKVSTSEKWYYVMTVGEILTEVSWYGIMFSIMIAVINIIEKCS